MNNITLYDLWAVFLCSPHEAYSTMLFML